MDTLEQKTIYKIGEQISKGGTGTIYAAKKLNSEGKADGIRYAIKEIGETFETIAQKEKEISQKIENESKYSVVIPILEAIHVQKKVYLIMQLKHQGMFLNEMIDEIRHETQQKSAVPFIHIKGILSAVLSSLSLLHNCIPDSSGYIGFLHLDLHPGNIFMENADWKNNVYGNVKFIDLQNAMELLPDGSVFIDRKKQLLGVTKGFCAPELMGRDFEHISIQTDLYSIACILLYMLTGNAQNHADWSMTGNVQNHADWSNGFSLYDTDEINKIFQEMGLVPASGIQLRRFLEKGLAGHALNRFEDTQEMQNCLEQAWKFQELYDSGNYYELYQLVFQSGLEKKHFSENSGVISGKGFWDSVKRLDHAMRQDGYQIFECQYIFQRLHALYKKQTDIANTETLALLYNSGLAIYNHLADNKKCVEISGWLLELKKDLPVMEWVSISNRSAVTYADIFQMDKAMQILEENIANLNKIKEAYCAIALKEEMHPGSARLVDLGRSYSAYATCLAHEGTGNPMEYFEKALMEFQTGKGNDTITISHILHYAVTREYAFFDSWYQKLTGGKHLENQDEIRVFIDSDRKKTKGFDLWIYLKAVYIYGLQNQIERLKERILELLDNKDFYAQNPFPTAMSLKYCGLLLYKLDKENCRFYADNALKKAMRKLEGGSGKEYGELTLFKIMSYHIQSEAFHASGNEKAAEKLYLEFMKRLDGSVFYRLKNQMEVFNKDKYVPKIILKGEYC